jgi:hypothetical protein
MNELFASFNKKNTGCRGVFKSGILGASKSGKRNMFSEVGW